MHLQYCAVKQYVIIIMAVAIDTNLLVALRATDLLLTPTPSRDHMLVSLSSID